MKWRGSPDLARAASSRAAALFLQNSWLIGASLAFNALPVWPDKYLPWRAAAVPAFLCRGDDNPLRPLMLARAVQLIMPQQQQSAMVSSRNGQSA